MCNYGKYHKNTIEFPSQDEIRELIDGDRHTQAQVQAQDDLTEYAKFINNLISYSITSSVLRSARIHFPNFDLDHTINKPPKKNILY